MLSRLPLWITLIGVGLLIAQSSYPDNVNKEPGRVRRGRRETVRAASRAKHTTPKKDFTPAETNTTSADARILDQIVCRVGEDAITMGDVEAFAEEMPGKIPYAHIVDQIINERLLAQEAKHEGISIRDTDLKRKYGQDTFEEWSKQEREQHRRKEMVIALISSRVTGAFSREERDIIRDKSDEIYGMHVNHLQVKIGRNEDEAREKAERIHKLLEQGKNLADLPPEELEGVNVGSMGLIRRGHHLKEFEEIVFALKPGEFSKPLRLGDAYQVLWIVGEESWQNHLWKQRRNDVLQDLLIVLRSESKVEYYLDRGSDYLLERSSH